MSFANWDTEFKIGGGGGEPQQLELNGFVLSLVPDGGSVTLPVGYVSSAGSVLIVSSVQARDSIVVGPNSNVSITSTGQINASIMAPQLLNALAINATNTTTTSLSTTNAQIQNLQVATQSMNQLNAFSISSGMINTSSIRAGGITISKDTGLGYTKVTGDSIGFYQNIDQYAPGQNINGRFFNGENYNATSSINVGSNIIASNVASNAVITLNGKVLSNTSQNLTYDSNPIYTGQRGDVSQWAQFPANGFVNVNGNGMGGVRTLYVDNEANLNNNANIVTNIQQGNVNILTKADGGFNPLNPNPAGNFTVGFSNMLTAPNSRQPNVGIYGCNLNLAAGAPFVPTYAGGRTINMDAYAGGVNVFPIVNADSFINITAHGNSFAGLDPLGAGKGNITLRAYNSAFGAIVPVPWEAGRIYLDASRIDIGNNNYLGLGTSALITMQSAVINLIAGLELGGISPFGSFSHTRIRSRDGVVIENTPLGTNNRDSKLYVRDIFGYSNFVNDFGPPALNIDGLDGGLTLNNFVAAYGQGDGADLNNIATMTGAYPTNVQNQIDALQNTIANISTTGGTSNIAQWSAYPALSTIVANRDLNFTGATASISSLAGVQFNNTAGSLTNTYQKRVYLDGRTATTGSTMIYFDLSAVSFINPATLAYNDLRANGLYFGPSNYLTVQSNVLQFNGQNLISTTGGGGGSNTFGPDPIVSSIQITASGSFYEGEFGTTNFNGPNGLRIQVGPNLGTGMLLQGDQILTQQENTGTSAPWVKMNPFATQSATFPNVALLNISSINGLPISTFTGGSGPSTIQNWSFFPVTSNSIQFGNQSVWLKGEGSALLTTSNGSNTIPLLAQSFSVYDPNTSNIIRNIGLDSNGVLTARRTDSNPSDFRVSSLILGTSPLTTDGTDLFLNGSNIGTSNVATWANYTAISSIRGSNVVLSNINANLAIFDTNVSDPRSTSIFVNAFQQQFINKSGNGLSLIGMTNQSNSLQIYNRAQDGLTIQTSGNVSNVRIIGDVQLGFGNTFTATSTIQNSAVVSSILLNTGVLTASNNALYFNGSVVNASNSADIWANFPAVSNVNINNCNVTNVNAISGGSLGTGGFSFTTQSATITANGGLTVQNPQNLYYSNAIITSGGNLGVSGLTSNYVVSPYGYAHQQITLGGTWFNTKVNDVSSQYQIRQFQGSNVVSTGTIYDTTFYPLPTYPVVRCTPYNVIRSQVYSSSGLRALINFGTFTPTTNNGIVTFQIVIPSTWSNVTGWIGCGPNASANYDDQTAVLIPPRTDSYSGAYWNTITMLVDTSQWIGSPYIFRCDASTPGTLTIKNVQYKPLPN